MSSSSSSPSVSAPASGSNSAAGSTSTARPGHLPPLRSSNSTAANRSPLQRRWPRFSSTMQDRQARNKDPRTGAAIDSDEDDYDNEIEDVGDEFDAFDDDDDDDETAPRFAHAYEYGAPRSYSYGYGYEGDGLRGSVSRVQAQAMKRPSRLATADDSYEATQRRREAAIILDNPELLMMHAESRQDSLAGTRHHFMEIMCGYDAPPSRTERKQKESHRHTGMGNPFDMRYE